jgi:hypothetical protein
VVEGAGGRFALMDKTTRGNASQFFVAGELCRRGYSAVVTLGNTPNTDILCSNIEGTKFVHIQVKTFVPGIKTCSVGKKAEKSYGENFFWILGGIPKPTSADAFQYFIIPASVVAANVAEAHRLWLETPGKNGRRHEATDVRTIALPPNTGFNGWGISEYEDRWDLIAEKLKD